MASLTSFSLPIPGGGVTNILDPAILAVLAGGIQVPPPQDLPADTLSFVSPFLTVTVQADAAGFAFFGLAPVGTAVGIGFFAPAALGGFQVLELSDISFSVTDFFTLLVDQDVQGLYDLILGGDDSILGAAGTDQMVAHTGNDTVDGQGGDDEVLGGDGDDEIRGGDGRDLIRGDRGNDRLDGGNGADTLDGANGRDAIHGGDGDDLIFGDLSIPSSFARAGRDTLDGGDGNDLIFGLGGHDILSGGNGNDLLAGGEGRDQLAGGAGADSLAGGSGGDRFRFDDIADLMVLPDGVDVILDFNPTEGDRIVLRGIDANETREGNQAFRFISDPSEIAAGRLMLDIVDLGFGPGTLVSLFTDADMVADGQFLVANSGLNPDHILL